MKSLLEQVENSICERKLLRRGARMLVAVSGGLDSIVLLRLLHVLAARHRWELLVAHFNHQLRGRASDADERFVAREATALGLRFRAGRGDVKARARKRHLSVEMAAREMRHEFLAKSAQRLKCRSIALAHHADDQVELFFLRLLRGAGAEGLAGMKWRAPSPADVKIHLIRPLLDVRRKELEKFARENKLRFREDATNASREILRNRIRHELLPLIRRRFQPALNGNLLRAMEIVGAETEVVDSIACAWLEKKKCAFSRLPVGAQRRVLQLQLRKLKLASDFDLIESLRHSSDKAMTIRPHVAVVRDRSGRVFLRTFAREAYQPNRLALELRGRAGEDTLDGLHLRWKVITRAGMRFQIQPGCEQFDADKVGQRIILRHWQPGDRFQPIGMRTTVKLQDWFTNQKIPRLARRNLILASTAGGEVFWIEDQRIDERFKLGEETKRRLIWTWRRG